MRKVSFFQGVELKCFWQFPEGHGQKIERVQESDVQFTDIEHLNLTASVDDEGRATGLRNQVLNEKAAVIRKVVEEDRKPLVRVTEHTDPQIVQGLEDSFASPTCVGTGRFKVLLGLLIDLGTSGASISAMRKRAVGSQIFLLAFRTCGLTHSKNERMSGLPAVGFLTVLTEATTRTGAVLTADTVRVG